MLNKGAFINKALKEKAFNGKAFNRGVLIKEALSKQRK